MRKNEYHAPLITVHESAGKLPANAGVRSTAKAILLHEGKVLLNRCSTPHVGEYYSLPGGGQEQYETLGDALARECREETGYLIEPVRFAALMEEICLDPFVRESYPQYAHKMLHIFLCRLASEERLNPTETDASQLGTEWIPVERIASVRLLPEAVQANFLRLVESETALFLGSFTIEYNHG